MYKIQKERDENMKEKVIAIIIGAGIGWGALTATADAHTVQPGDTMSKLATANGLSLQQISEYNPQVANINRIYVGQNINTAGTESASTTSGNYYSTRETNQQSTATTSDQQLIAQLVHAEAGNQGLVGRIAVASVVLNRVASGEFPGTVSGVIYQAGQFDTVASGAINNTPTILDYQAVSSAMAGSDPSGGALYFYNPSYAGGAWWDSMTTTAVIGNHTFKR